MDYSARGQYSTAVLQNTSYFDYLASRLPDMTTHKGGPVLTNGRGVGENF